MAKRRRSPEPSAPAVQRVSLDTIQPDRGNTRRRKDRGRRALDESLQRFGAGRSIVLDGADVVRAGNGTLEAAKRAGFKEVLVVEPDPGTLVAVKRSDWTAAEARAYGIADNRTNDLSEFNPVALAATLDDLRADGFDIDALELDARRDQEPVTADDLKEWDASELSLSALFTFRAPIELQPKIRALLREHFPDATFEEDVVYG